MKGLIIHEQTDMEDMLAVLGSMAADYNWLLSDYECSYYPSAKIPIAEHFVWLSGSEFVDILREHKIQFIWGVASAFAKNISIDDILSCPLPFADGNPDLWNTEVRLQNPLPDIEIVAWDSSLAIVIAKSKAVLEKYAKKYPGSENLTEYNRRK